MTSVETFELRRAMAESFAASTSLLGDLSNLEQHLRDLDAQLIFARGLDAKRELARDYALSSALLEYARSVAPFLRTEVPA